MSRNDECGCLFGQCCDECMAGRREPTPDLSRNFRAQAWMWFRVCRGCGELFDTGPLLDRMRDRARENGARVRPRKYCTGCVMRVVMSWWKDDDDAE